MSGRDVILSWAERVMRSRPPDLMIGEEGDPSTLRWHLLPRNNWLNLYLHLWLKSDRDVVLHDHPYDNLSYIVEGHYFEQFVGRVKLRQRGDFAWRRAAVGHRVLVARPCVSLFLTGRRYREWGFHCPGGWVHWSKFIDSRDYGNRDGAGCGATG